MSRRRKLAAILSADVVGYSRLMAADEAATLETLKSYRDIIARLVLRHGGRVVNAPGDALLAEFPSAVEAVQAAVEVQKSLEGHNIDLEPERRMRFRIGVNLGDVIEEADGTIYGDGVNIAARMEALAEAGGVCISSTIYDAVEGKLSFGFDFLGEQQVKNISKPVRVYRVRGEPRPAPLRSKRRVRWQITIPASALIVALGAVGAWRYRDLWTPAPPTADVGAALKLPQEPSIAILPLQNMSCNPQDDWFSDGMTETLITDLSRLKNLFVIARNSSFSYKGKSMDVRQVGRELGVRYVLEGSVQRTSEWLRVNAQLVEAQTGRHLWAERYDRKLDDVLEIQDDIAQNIVTELQVTLLAGEQARAWRKTSRNRQAYELYLKGREHHERFTREDMLSAQALHEQALQLDPKFTMAMVGLGMAHYQQGDAGWSSNPRDSYLKAVALGQKAAAIDPSLGDAYVMFGSVLLTLERHSEGMAATDRALALSPNQADVLAVGGWNLAGNGRAQEAIPLVHRALRLNPIPPDWYYGALGDSLLFSNQPDEAIPVHRRCVERIPDFIWCQLGLTVAYVESGKLEQATIQAREAMRINPKMTASDNTYVRTMGIPEDRARVVKALRQAGLPG